MIELKENIKKHIDLLCERYPALKIVEDDIARAYQILEDSYKNGGKLLVAGNGGSAADAEHIVGELMKGFKLPRKPQSDFADKLIQTNTELGAVLAENLQGALPAIALDGHPALSTAYMNDCEPLLCFAQQVNGYGKTGDVFLGISTSGNSKKVLYAATTAHAKGMKVIGLTGAKSSKLEQMSDVCIKVPQICAGATVDFLAGNVKRAPRWMSEHGLEWFYRFLQEPKRMFKRYFINDIKIVNLIRKYR